ncbi:MAG: 3'-5' exonuclease [Bacteroidetes bacterium]|nr:3'-5' exonuclease [Bacteroidota bacterium]
MKFAILDVETTGSNPVTDRGIELGIVFMDDGEIVGRENFIFNPERKLSSKIKQLTGLTDDVLEDAPFFEVFAEQIAYLTRDRIVVGHHVSFDYAFLRNEMKLSGVRFSRNTLCTAELSRYLFLRQLLIHWQLQPDVPESSINGHTGPCRMQWQQVNYFDLCCLNYLKDL